MAAPPMDPLYEQRLRDEVLYLHALWHQGPPRPAHHHHHNHHLHPSQPTKFKRKYNQEKPQNTSPKPHSSPGLEWTVPSPPPPPPADVWPSFEAKSYPKPTLSAEDLAKSAAKRAHQHALKTVADFFRHNNNKNADDDSDFDSIGICSSDDDDESMDEDDDERVGYVFFNDVFKEDNELREYYMNNFARGEFTCLVCGALGGKKMGKKFKGCLALVQHSISIAKTKKRRAHRAFGQTVCKVLGWDINELSTIVSLLSDNPKEIQVVNNVVSVEGNIVECKNDEAVPESGEGGDMISVTCADEADKSSEEVGMKGPAAEGLTDEMGSANNKEGLAIVDNVLTLEGKNDEALKESEAIGAEISADGDEGGMSCLTCTNDDNSLEDIHEHAAEGVTNVPQ